MPGPLDAICVVDLTSLVSGPLATVVLANQGAEVLRELGLTASEIEDLRAKQILG